MGSVGATLLLAPAAFYGGVAYGSHSTTPQSAAMDLVVQKDVIESEPKMQSCRPSIPRRQIMVPMPWHHDRQAVQLDPGVKGGMLHFFLHRNDRVRQSSLLAGPALSIFV